MIKKWIALVTVLAICVSGMVCAAEENEIRYTVKKTENEYYTVLMLEDCEQDPTFWGSTNMDAREHVNDAKQGNTAFHTMTPSDYCIIWRDMEMRECPVAQENAALEFWVKVASTNMLRDGCFVAELNCLDGYIAQWWIEGEDVPTKEWVRITLPLAQTVGTNINEGFDVESITRFRLVAFNEDFRGNDIVIDDIKIVDMTRKPDGSPIAGTNNKTTTTKATTTKATTTKATTTAATTTTTVDTTTATVDTTTATVDTTTATVNTTTAAVSEEENSEDVDVTSEADTVTTTTNPDVSASGDPKDDETSVPWGVVAGIVVAVVVVAGGIVGLVIWKKKKQA